MKSIEEMNYQELHELLEKTSNQIARKVLLWIISIIILFIVWFPAGLILAVVFLVKVCNRYHDGSFELWAYACSLAFKKEVYEKNSQEKTPERKI